MFCVFCRYNDLQQYSVNSENIVTFLVGTKCHAEQQREITTQQAQALADHLDITYMEVSSEENINVNDVFEKLTTKITEKFQRKPEAYHQLDITSLIGKQDRRSQREKDKCSC